MAPVGSLSAQFAGTTPTQIRRPGGPPPAASRSGGSAPHVGVEARWAKLRQRRRETRSQWTMKSIKAQLKRLEVRWELQFRLDGFHKFLVEHEDDSRLSGASTAASAVDAVASGRGGGGDQAWDGDIGEEMERPRAVDAEASDGGSRGTEARDGDVGEEPERLRAERTERAERRLEQARENYLSVVLARIRLDQEELMTGAWHISLARYCLTAPFLYALPLPVETGLREMVAAHNTMTAFFERLEVRVREEVAQGRTIRDWEAFEEEVLASI
eukprot:TRINITY_DN17877_c0_g2_i1.p1 TRINITY_DN17877_c0_g2~~TRINITY_DN17877_c0_g2_i1.p1  ORF type:complete len:272 (-),score=57.81 TRINITY_DN17877_c0_g2_i1:124-939(-)